MTEVKNCSCQIIFNILSKFIITLSLRLSMMTMTDESFDRFKFKALHTTFILFQKRLFIEFKFLSKKLLEILVCILLLTYL